MKIGKYKIHRKEQWDIGCHPLVCVHRQNENGSERVFCLWLWGVEVSGERRWVKRSSRRRTAAATAN